MVDSNGVPKGLTLVLEERGVDTTNMVREDMVKVLSEFQDFREERTAVYTYLVRVIKYLCLFRPKVSTYLHSISGGEDNSI